MKLNIEVRAKKVIIEGYVNAVNRDSRALMDAEGKTFVEQIVAGTFSKALERGTDVRILLNHDEKRDVGGLSNGTLSLHEDTIGLYARAEINDPEVVQLAKEKRLRGWSFGYIPLEFGPQETTNTGIERRFVNDLELIEVSIISDAMIPAYSGTSIQARAQSMTVNGN